MRCAKKFFRCHSPEPQPSTLSTIAASPSRPSARHRSIEGGGPAAASARAAAGRCAAIVVPVARCTTEGVAMRAVQSDRPGVAELAEVCSWTMRSSLVASLVASLAALSMEDEREIERESDSARAIISRRSESILCAAGVEAFSEADKRRWACCESRCRASSAERLGDMSSLDGGHVARRLTPRLGRRRGTNSRLLMTSTGESRPLTRDNASGVDGVLETEQQSQAESRKSTSAAAVGARAAAAVGLLALPRPLEIANGIVGFTAAAR